ncbi:MAG: hypothetical protein HQ582_31525 [Planctomycetes bacterium]|nr:hypothetical protein [Planctomycetota bacterium]
MVSKNNGPLVIEIDGPHNRSLIFQPLGRSVRGRFEPARVAGGAGRLAIEFPEGIPGQRLGFDPSSGGFIDEPLQHDEHAAVAKVARKHGTIPEREEFPDADMPTWLWWLRETVRCGLAKLVEGELPETIEGEPRKSFFHAKTVDPIDRLTAAMEKQNEILAKLISKQ